MRMRSRSPALAPGQPAYGVTVHIVLDDFGSLGRAFVETDEADADEKTIVENSSPANIHTRFGWSRSTPLRGGRAT